MSIQTVYTLGMGHTVTTRTGALRLAATAAGCVRQSSTSDDALARARSALITAIEAARGAELEALETALVAALDALDDADHTGDYPEQRALHAAYVTMQSQIMRERGYA